jgi:Fibronectin type III domain
MSCPSAGNCVSVGTDDYEDYEDSNQQGLIETESNGTWTPTAVADSALPDANPEPELYSVSCVSVGNCAAAGYYFFNSSTNDYYALLDTEANGTWTASAPDLTQLPDPGSDTRNAYLYDVTCVSAGNCTAVGGYQTALPKDEGLIETETNGAWTASEADLAGLSTATNPQIDLPSVSCTSAGNCVAVGYYLDSASSDQPLIETETNGVWAVSAPNLTHLPDAGATTEFSILSSVSCVSAGNCTAVGTYYDLSNDEHGLVETETNGTWAPAEASLAGLSTNSDADAYFNSVSCASAGNCTAVGVYEDSSLDYQGLELTETGGQWGNGVEAKLPVAGEADPVVALYSVACSAPGSCVATGTYQRSDSYTEVLVERESGGSWQADGTEQPNPSDNINDNAAVVACAPGGYCAVGGYVYDDNADIYAAFLLDAPDAVATPSASVSGTQATVSWSAPLDGGGLSLTGYTVTANDLTDAARGGQTVTLAATAATSTTFTGLTPGDSYTFSVSGASLLGTGLAATSAAVSVPALKPAAPTRAQLLASLRPLLSPHGSAAKFPKLRRTHSYKFTYHALEAGKVTVRWYWITGRRKRKHKTLVASGSAKAHGAGAVKLTVHLTAKGRRLVAAGHHLKLTAVVSFAGGRLRVSRTRGFTLS